MLNTNTRAERSQGELQQALLTAARSISIAIQQVTALGHFDGLVGALEDLYTHAELAEKHRDIVDPEAPAFAAAHTDLVLQVYRRCQYNARRSRYRQDAKEARRMWAQNLPAGAALKTQIEAEGDGARWEGLTFWKDEEEGGYWSVTNAYGIDNVAWARTSRDFQRLIDQLRANDGDVGPIPPMCQDDEEDQCSTWCLGIVFYDAAEMILSQRYGSDHVARL